MNYPAMRYVAEVCTVQGAGRAILWAIAYRADRDDGECWAGQRRIASEAGVARGTVQRVIPELLEAGELELVAGSAGPKARRYRIVGADSSGLTTSPVASGLTTSPVGGLVDSSGGASGLIGGALVDSSSDVTGPYTSPLSSGSASQGFEGKIEGWKQVRVAAGSAADAAGGNARRIPPELVIAVATLDPAAEYDPGTAWSGDSITLGDGAVLPNTRRAREWLAAKSKSGPG
jgi:hypothetical protein